MLKLLVTYSIKFILNIQKQFMITLMQVFFERGQCEYGIWKGPVYLRERIFAKLMDTYVSRSGRVCSWKNPAECISSCMTTPGAQLAMHPSSRLTF